MSRPIMHSLVTALGHVPGFDLLDEDMLLRIVGASVNLFWAAGSFVFRKDSPGDALYVVLAGEVRVTGGGMEKTIEPGDYFGEMSLLRHSTHTKDVEAVKDSELLVLPADSFRRLLAASPDLMTLIQKRLRQREHEFDRVETEAPRKVM